MRFDLNHIPSSSSDDHRRGGCDDDDDGELLLWFVRFDLRHEGAVFGDKTIGEVRVPLKDLIDESNGVVRFLSYQIKTTEGKPNGVISFSCKFNSSSSAAAIRNQIQCPDPPNKEEEGDEVDDGGRVHYPMVASQDLESVWPQQQSEYPPPPPPHPHHPPPPPPHPHHPPPLQEPSSGQGGYCYYYPHPPRPPGRWIQVQEPWAPPDPVKFGAYYYCGGPW